MCLFLFTSITDTTIPKILENNAVKEKTNEEELKLFSFVTPKTSAVQQRLENIRKGLPPVPKISSPNNLNHNIYSPSSQLNNYDSDDNMEWEDAIDSSNVVDQVINRTSYKLYSFIKFVEFDS